MASYTTVADWRDVESGYVVVVTIRRTEAEAYPSGWDYSLHFGEVGGDTVLRYDNAHERTKGHERHAGTTWIHRISGNALALRPVQARGDDAVARPVGVAGVGRRKERHYAHAQSHRRRT